MTTSEINDNIEPLKGNNEVFTHANHLKEVARIRRKYISEMTDRELNVIRTLHTVERDKSLKVIKAWITFFGILQILAFIIFIIYFFQIIVKKYDWFV